MYYKRKIDHALAEWCIESGRKPLLLRGARQVGKSSTVRELSKSFAHFLEVNFEEQREVHKLFAGDLSPKELCSNLSIMYRIPVIPGQTLLFLDEIQACPRAISALRFFYEKYPDLHVIAAGSLLEFALEELPSYGVGRVRSMFVYPFSMDEFLSACGEDALLDVKLNASAQNPLVEPLHRKLLDYFKRFAIIGGMPEVVATYCKSGNLLNCQQILDDLVLSLRDDFAKYKYRVPASRIAGILDAVVRQNGKKFVYNKAAAEYNIKQVKEALDLLSKAGLVIPVTHSASNGIPLGAEEDPKKRKILIFDTGVFQRLLGLNISDVLFQEDFDLVNKGGIAELYTGLEIRKAASATRSVSLHYWHRESLNSNAEVDYVIQKQDIIIPIEVKSGKKGSMQSLYLFLKEKKRHFGVRFSLENYSSYDQIRSYPLYSVSDFCNESGA
jgi:predicted AAA+ superfamily ATPase